MVDGVGRGDVVIRRDEDIDNMRLGYATAERRGDESDSRQTFFREYILKDTVYKRAYLHGCDAKDSVKDTPLPASQCMLRRIPCSSIAVLICSQGPDIIWGFWRRGSFRIWFVRM